MKKLFKIFIPITITILAVAFIFIFETKISPNLNTQEVLVAGADIPFKGEINAENLTVKKVQKDNIVGAAYKPNEVEEILFKSAGIEIKEGTQIYPELIDAFDLIPDQSKGEFIAPIPDEWLYAVPGSLRRNYVADFYAIPDSDEAIIQSMSLHVDENEDLEDEGESNSSIDEFIVGSKRPLLTDVKVSSVKDGSNKEVTETEDENSATGVISNVEIIATDDSLVTLRDATEQGYKIYVVYKYER